MEESDVTAPLKWADGTRTSKHPSDLDVTRVLVCAGCRNEVPQTGGLQ